MSNITLPVVPSVSCIQEAGVTDLMPCNIWQVRGPDCDPVINTDMGLNPSKNYIARSNDQLFKAITTHF